MPPFGNPFGGVHPFGNPFGGVNPFGGFGGGGFGSPFGPRRPPPPFGPRRPPPTFGLPNLTELFGGPPVPPGAAPGGGPLAEFNPFGGAPSGTPDGPRLPPQQGAPTPYGGPPRSPYDAMPPLEPPTPYGARAPSPYGVMPQAQLPGNRQTAQPDAGLPRRERAADTGTRDTTTGTRDTTNPPGSAANKTNPLYNAATAIARAMLALGYGGGTSNPYMSWIERNPGAVMNSFIGSQVGGGNLSALATDAAAQAAFTDFVRRALLGERVIGTPQGYDPRGLLGMTNTMTTNPSIGGGLVLKNYLDDPDRAANYAHFLTYGGMSSPLQAAYGRGLVDTLERYKQEIEQGQAGVGTPSYATYLRYLLANQPHALYG
jgi:hypothetical protein